MSEENVEIETCGVSDAPAVAEIGRATFVETYAEQTDAEEMRRYVDQAFDPGRITAELSEPESTFYLARSGGTVAGYLKVNRGAAQTELQGKSGIEIESLYVLDVFQGQGVGRLLLARAFEEAREEGAKCIWLGVWERNTSARRFWKKMGFVEFGSHAFRFGSVEHTDLMMRRGLDA